MYLRVDLLGGGDGLAKVLGAVELDLHERGVAHHLDEVQVAVVEARAAHRVVLGRLVEAQVHQQLAALQRRAHQRLVRGPVPDQTVRSVLHEHLTLLPDGLQPSLRSKVL